MKILYDSDIVSTFREHIEWAAMSPDFVGEFDDIESAEEFKKEMMLMAEQRFKVDFDRELRKELRRVYRERAGDI